MKESKSAACVLDELPEDLEVDDLIEEDIQNDTVNLKEDSGVKNTTTESPSAKSEKSWDTNQLVIVGLVACILILSVAVVVYAARH
jgi:hypothetical protein